MRNWYKPLEGGTFEDTESRDRVVRDDGSTATKGIEMRLTDLTLILEGIDLAKGRHQGGGVVQDAKAVLGASTSPRSPAPNLGLEFFRTKWQCRASHRAWSTEVHLLPINWPPASNGFVSWSRQDAEQQAVIAQQQEAIAAYQEQLAKAAEQLRFFKRVMFGQRRERYAPSPDQKLLFVPEVVEGLDAQQQNPQRRQRGLAAASDSTKATTTEDRVPAILGTPADRVSASRGRIALRLLRHSGASPASMSRSGWRWKRRSCTWSKRCGTPTAARIATTARRC